jgi:hypothetical protein
MKPTSKCQGQGIFIIDKLSQVAPYRLKVIQNISSATNVTSLKPPIPSQKQKK